MKLIFLLLAATGLFTTSALAAGSEAIIKQRAKELSNQNNVQQGVPSPAQPAPSPAPATTTSPVLTPQARLQAHIAAIKPNSQVTPQQKQQLAADLIALATGPTKPSLGAANKLAQDMSAALVQKAPSEGARSRLVQDLHAAFSAPNTKAAQMEEIISDVQAVFQASGVSRKEAIVIADDVKAIVAELQRGSK